jgi:hypothetical protein
VQSEQPKLLCCRHAGKRPACYSYVALTLSEGRKLLKLKSWELLNRQCDPFKSISFVDHCLDIRFAITYHKMQVPESSSFHPLAFHSRQYACLFSQGQTIARLILDLNKWPSDKLTHSQVLVGLTRVQDMAHCRTLPLLPGQTRKHLYNMRPDPEMLRLSFLCGFHTPDGKWSQQKAHEALDKCSKAAKPKPQSTRAAPQSTPRKSLFQPTSAPPKP